MKFLSRLNLNERVRLSLLPVHGQRPARRLAIIMSFLSLIVLYLMLLAPPDDGAAARTSRPLPERKKVELSDVMWQPLPAAVAQVFVDPSDRAWFVMSQRPTMELPDIKRLIEREFTQPDPQLYNVRPALFEPGGRVWFTWVRHDREGKYVMSLLGYDGKGWIERDVPSQPGVGAMPENHVHDFDTGVNLWIAGHAFFAVSGAAVVFDGKDVVVQEFLKPDKDGRTHAPLFVREPDGKGLLAIMNGCDDPLWRWHDDKWTPLPVPVEALAWIRGAAPVMDRGAWLMVGGGRVVFAPYDAPRRRLTDVVKQLADGKPAVRDEAQSELTLAGPNLTQRLIDIQATQPFPNDDDANQRLTTVVNELRGRKGNAPWGKSIPPSTFGSYTLDIVRALWSDGHGHVFAMARKIWRSDDPNAAQQAQAGFVMLDAAGDYLPMLGNDMAARWKNLNTEWGFEAGPLSVGDGKAVWLPGDRQQTPAALFDIKRGKITAECPDPKFHYLQATKSDGTLFIGQDWVLGGRNGQVMMMRPGTRDNRATITAQNTIDSSAWFCISDDGSVVATDPKDHLLRFAAGKWSAVQRPENAPALRRMLPGKHGAILAQHSADEGWSLLTPNGEVSEPSLDDLLQKHQASFGDFIGAPLTGYDAREPSIAFDKLGNVWLSRRPDLHLRVLANGQWIDATEQLKAAGMRRGYVTFLAPVGDGTRIYMTDYGLRHDGGGSLLGRCTPDGKLEFEQAPHSTSEFDMPRPVREPLDAGGGLWVASSTGFAQRTSDAITGQFASRITEKGVVAEVKGSKPVLGDRSGNAWLLSLNWDGPAKTSICRDGKIVASFETPGVDKDSRFFSDKPGSAWTWTASGLTRYLESPANSGQYTMQQIYSPRELSGFVKQVELSPAGYLVVLTSSGYPNERFKLSLLPLPK
jgi:hypothetical protein